MTISILQSSMLMVKLFKIIKFIMRIHYRKKLIHSSTTIIMEKPRMCPLMACILHVGKEIKGSYAERWEDNKVLHYTSILYVEKCVDDVSVVFKVQGQKIFFMLVLITLQYCIY